MYKTAIFCLLAALFFTIGVAVPSANSGENSGEALFRSLHCNGCHKAEGKGVGMDL